jgi:conjugative relaxase-like TrwC/TraI family protein
VNKSPSSGERLTERSRDIAFYDFQISAPKSVSIQAITIGDDRLLKAHEESWRFAFQEFERYSARRDREGENANKDEIRFTGNLLTAVFTHDASRALDANIHTHLVCANATYDAEKKQWFALQNSELYKAREVISRLYSNELAKRAIALGYEVRLTTEKGKLKGWELAHITDAECELQSTRRKQIEEKIAEFIAKTGLEPSAVMKHAMAVSTRESGLREISTPEVRAAQRAKYSQETIERFEREKAEAIARSEMVPSRSISTEDIEKQTRAAIESAMRHQSYTEAVFDEKAILSRVLRENPGQIDFGIARELIGTGLGGQLVRLPDGQRRTDPLTPSDHAKLTTLENLRLERHSVELIRGQVGKHQPLATEYNLEPDLSTDQRSAVENILECRDGVMCLRGPAGTGKTTTLSELDRVVHAVASGSGLDAVYVAPMHAAKGVLQADGFKNASTVARLMVELNAGRLDLRGKLLVVDEAGMQSTKDGHALLAAATAAGARVLYVGDQKQLSAVEAGDFLGIMQEHSPMRTVELFEIHRQRDPGYRAAMQEMAQGHVGNALAMLDKQGRIRESGSDYLTNAADEYCRKTAEKGPDGEFAPVALVAATWREVDKLNELVREKLKASGEIHGPAILKSVVDKIAMSPEEQCSARNYEPGMVISPTRKRFAGMEPGQWCRVDIVERGVLVLENGRRIQTSNLGDKIQVGRRRELEFQIGDKILFQGNDKLSGLTNGTRGVVTGFDGTNIRFRPVVKGKENGQEQTIPCSYETLTYGFATTIHASQGQTVRDVIGATAKRLSGQLWNVMTSRGRRDVLIHLPQKDAVLGFVANSIKNRPAALDYLQANELDGHKETANRELPSAVSMPVPREVLGPAEKHDRRQEAPQKSEQNLTRSNTRAVNGHTAGKLRRILRAFAAVANRLGSLIPSRSQTSPLGSRVHRRSPQTESPVNPNAVFPPQIPQPFARYSRVR